MFPEMFREHLRNFKNVITSLFSTNFHEGFTVLFEMFYSFSEIKLNLFWISPLMESMGTEHSADCLNQQDRINPIASVCVGMSVY